MLTKGLMQKWVSHTHNTYRCKSDEDLIGSVELITYLSAAEEHQSELATAWEV